MNIDFIKKCVPFADEFEISQDLDGDEILYHGNDFNIRSVYLRCAYKSTEFGSLLTRTIEGINRKHLNNNKYPVIIIDAWDIEVRFYNSNIEDFQKGLDNWDTIDDAKISAIEYIFEEEIKNE